MTPGEQAEVMRKGRELIRVGIVRGDRCHFCGRRHEGRDNLYGAPERGPWEGWELSPYTEYQRCIADKPESLCPCERRGE